jgi:MFS family permease
MPYWRVVGFSRCSGWSTSPTPCCCCAPASWGSASLGVVGAYALYNTSYAALSYPAEVVSDRLPRRLVFAVGLGVFAVAYLGLGIVTTPAWVWLLLPLYGGYTALTDGVGGRGSPICYQKQVSAPALASTKAWPAAPPWAETPPPPCRHLASC